MLINLSKFFLTNFFKANSVNKLHASGLKMQQDEYGTLETWLIIVKKLSNLDNPDKTEELVNIFIILVLNY